MIKCNVIAIANQKGGVGKTTTTFNLGVALAKMGKRVLLIDTDPQANLTTCMGYYDTDNIPTIATVMEQTINGENVNLNDVILHHDENVDLIPSHLDLSATESSISNAINRENVLKNSIKDIKDNYDYILIDCMPSLGLLTINAFSCSNKVIVPVQTQFLAARNMAQLMRNVYNVKKLINPDLFVDGILLTLVDNRTNLAKDVISELHETYGSMFKIYKSQIPMAVKAAEATMEGKSIFEYYKNSPVATAYMQLAKEVDDSGKSKKKDSIDKAR